MPCPYGGGAAGPGMAEGLTCDRCGKNLLIDESVRYTVRIEVFAAYDPMELTDDDLAKDHDAEIKKLLQKIQGMSEEEMMDSVYRRIVGDLCPPCQKQYLDDPLSEAGHRYEGLEAGGFKKKRWRLEAGG